MGKHISPELWLQHNLSSSDRNFDASLLNAPGHSFRLRILPILLGLSALSVIAMWYEERSLNLMNMADIIGYPVLLVVTTLGALLIKFRPESLRHVMVTAFTSYVAYQLSSYYIEIFHRFDGISSSYELTALSLWLPFGYVGGFVFFSPRTAVRISLALYTAIALPLLMLLAVDPSPVARIIYIEILISQPLFIVALWGVGLIKTQASGVHDLAKSMNRAASVDALTGIANRRVMDYALEILTQLPSGTERPLALLLIDVDHFKSINDRYGHAVGDAVLITLAQEASSQLRMSDLLGRWGGEEFMIISLDQSGASAFQMGDRLRARLEKLELPQVGHVTVSIGVTSYIPGEEVGLFINRADRALYQAKALGRNRVEGQFCE